MNPSFNLGSNRARQARFSVVMSATWLRLALILLALIAAGLGSLMLYAHINLAWFVLGFSAWPLLPLIWYNWWLRDLPPTKAADSIDGSLTADILGHIKANPSPQQLAEAAIHSKGGLFFAIRLGISPNFLRELGSPNPDDTAAVWRAALSLKQELGATTISGAILTAALASVLPNRDQLLAQLQLTQADVTAGARWFHHLQDLVASTGKRKKGGGIGRDLSFGFTPLLERLAVNVSSQVTGGTLTRELEGHKQLLDVLMQQLSSGGRQNAVLVGPLGVGKTTLVYSLAERLLLDGTQVPANLRFRQVMMLDPATLLANASARGQLESLLTQILNEAYHAKNVILFLDNAELFFSNEAGAVDLRNVLMPVLEGGALRMLMSMDEQQWLRLSRATPTLTQQLNRINVAPLDQNDTLLVCEDQLLSYEFSKKVTYMYQALQAAYRLGARYIADQAMPGQALKVLEAAAQYADRGLVTAASVEKAVEQIAGVKVSNARQGDERQLLLGLEDLIHQRMINQTRAVNVVANALRRE